MNLQDLKKTLPYQWRVQSINTYAAVCVAYIDSRDVQDLLDDVCGADNWQSDYKEVKGNVYAGVGIKTGGEWVWKWDCGVESKTEAEKGEASDSFKRAAVKWGVGRFLYSLEIKKLKVTTYKDKTYPLNEGTGKAIFSGEELTNYINSRHNDPNYVFGFDYSSLHQDGLIQLLESSTFEERQKKTILANINDHKTMNEEKYKKIKTNLEANQLDPISSGMNYNQGDISRKIRKEIA